MNIREISKIGNNYFEINREERNYAAIFFTALCKKGNIERFLKHCNISEPIKEEEFGIYFEYSFLRDIWFNIGNNNDVKKNIIRKKLRISDIDYILDKQTEEINKIFGVAGVPSKDYIQSPGSWAITKFHKNFLNEVDFLKICMFKWSFNIKPDIVIHLDKDNAICIEAKYESGEGSYPSNLKDIEIYDSIVKNRNPKRVSQLELQKYMMEELLGIKTEFLILSSKSIKSETHKNITWSSVFESLDTSGLPAFATRMIKNMK